MIYIKCARCGGVVRRVGHMRFTVLDEMVEGLQGRRCPWCGYRFKGVLAGRVSIRGCDDSFRGRPGGGA